MAAFGDRGFVDLKAGVRGVDGPFMLESPPVVYKNVLITGGTNTEGEPSLGLYGDIRGWDARTGRLLWSFHTVPRPGEPGVETWEGESWKNRSGTNAWTYMTLDVDRGLVFAPPDPPRPISMARIARGGTSTRTHSSRSMRTPASSSGSSSSCTTTSGTGICQPRRP